MPEPIGGDHLTPEGEWRRFMMRLYMDGPRGPHCDDVVRRFVAGEIAVRPRERLCDLLGVNGSEINQ